MYCPGRGERRQGIGSGYRLGESVDEPVNPVPGTVGTISQQPLELVSSGVSHSGVSSSRGVSHSGVS